MRELPYPEAYAASFGELARDSRLVETMTQLLGSNVAFHVGSLYAKPPGGGVEFAVHQDSQFMPHEGEPVDYVDTIIYLTDAPTERGPVQFIPGSHREGLGDRYPERSVVPEEIYTLEDAVEVPARAGDVVLFDLQTAHGSGVNRSETNRIQIRLGYKDPTAIQTGGLHAEKRSFMVAGERPPGHVSEWGWF